MPPARSNSWLQAFPYRDGEALVTRLERGWRLSLGTMEVERIMLVDAFEELRHAPAGEAEMRVVIAALAWDQAFGTGPGPGQGETDDERSPEAAVAEGSPVEREDAVEPTADP